MGTFITDLTARLAQLDLIAREPAIERGICLGKLFSPEGFLTATRQTVAHMKGWSLEQLELSLSMGESGVEDSFAIEGKFCPFTDNPVLTADVGLITHGATWTNDHLAVNDGELITLESSRLGWRKRDSSPNLDGQVNLPVYRNEDRSDVLFSVDLEALGVSQAVFAQRGVCITIA